MLTHPFHLSDGRNHHLNGFASISETAAGFPGYGFPPRPAEASIAEILRKAGWGTYWAGENPTIPVDEWTARLSRDRRPPGQGFDRFYGFVGDETDQRYPDRPRTTISFHRTAVSANSASKSTTRWRGLATDETHREQTTVPRADPGAPWTADIKPGCAASRGCRRRCRAEFR
nr:sulfatase-like hydrolase/transferase [Nocardia spumae]